MDNDIEEIVLPKELYDKLELTSEREQVEVIDNARDSFTVRAVGQNLRSDYAPRWFWLPTLLATAIFAIIVLALNPHVLPMSGSNGSIATGVITIANAAAFVTFILAYIARRHELYHSMARAVYWRTFPTVLAAYLIIASLGLVAFFWFIEQIFHGVAFDKLTSILIFAIFAAILNYFVIFIVDTFNITMLVNMLILVIVGGLVASMATNGNQYWWQRNFSLLGTRQSASSWQFNLTLVVAAAVFVALIDYVFVTLSQKYKTNWRHLTLRILLYLTALCIAGVGLIPNNGHGFAHYAHDHIAMAIVFFMGLAILGLKWLLPQASKNLVRLSYAIAIMLAASYILWSRVHYLTLTAFEIFSFSLSFAWLMLFINDLLALLWDGRKVFKVRIKEEN